MSATQLYCPDSERLSRLRAEDPPEVNAIEYVEVLPGMRALAVHCLADVGPLGLANVEIEGGVGVEVQVVAVHRAADLPAGLLDAGDEAALPAAGRERILIVATDSSGDLSTYRLRLVAAPESGEPAPGFDPILCRTSFSFKVGCPSDFDCRSAPECAPEDLAAPRIDYLARDYASFRKLMLDRLAQTVPDWRERNPADLGVALVETIAFAADRISYGHDAAATEAYLGTARLRASVRRHARLVDYRLDEGRAARAWIAVEVDREVELPAETRVVPSELLFRSGDPGDNRPLVEAVLNGGAIFETLEKATMLEARNCLDLHTWGDAHCCLPKGATSATLRGKQEEVGLAAGDVLVLERVGPDREPLSANRERHAVRLLADGVAGVDPLEDVEVIEVAWGWQDALLFALDLSERDDGAAVVARANTVLAEHGLTVAEPDLAVSGGRLRLGLADLTHVAPYDRVAYRSLPAAAAIAGEDGEGRVASVPWLKLTSADAPWGAEPDLLGCGPLDSRFVVEMEEDRTARVRFGDGVNGRRPGEGQSFDAVYRIGNGVAGNLGAEALGELRPPRGEAALPLGAVRVRNPLPAAAGRDPEPLERARLDAPYAFRVQERAVTAADYAEVAERHREVQRAVATRRWTGSWYTMFLSVDRRSGEEVDAAFEQRLRRHMERFRMAGYDLEVGGPAYVAVDLALSVCVDPAYVAADVELALRAALSNRTLPAGRGFFHPDNLSFGEPLYLSRIVARAMALEGVGLVRPLRFQRRRAAGAGELDRGRMDLARLEIARLDDDPSRPENGRLELEMRGGS